MSIRNLDRIFKPGSLALIGASSRAGSIGNLALRNLLRAGFRGPLYLVSPEHRSLEGMTVYPDVERLPTTPDLAVIATPPETIAALVRELGGRGTKAAVIITGGFGELSERGGALETEILAAAQPHTLRLIGPDSLGVMVPAGSLDASVSHLPPLKGDLGFVSQSGALISAVLDWAEPRGLGFSHVVSLGDMADVDFGDMIDYLAADSGTRAILLYVEEITHARKFMSAARAASRIKPMLVVKAGRFLDAAYSGTGAFAGSDAVYDAAFRRAGMLRVDNMAELFDAVETLALIGLQGERLAILTNGGAPGVLASDALIRLGGKLAQLSTTTVAALDGLLPASSGRGNPVDIGGDASGASYGGALSLLLADRGVDAVLVLNCPSALGDPSEAARAVIDRLAVSNPSSAPRAGRNVFTAWLGEHSAAPARQLFAAARIATYETPDGAVQGFMHRVRYRRNQALLREAPPARPDPFEPAIGAARAAIDRALSARRRWLAADEVTAVLGAYAIPMVRSRSTSDPEGAAAAAAEIGMPVALKVRSADLTKKSEVGGVVLNLGTPARVRAEALAMLDRVRAARPAARIDGFLVQEMVTRPGARELIIAVSDDRIFGPVVIFGQGGTAAELLADTSLELPPLNIALARSQMARTRVWRLLEGDRGQPACDIDAVAEVLIRVGQLAADHAEIAELEVNPLIADAAGVIAVDARIAVAPSSISGPARLSIPPYPSDLETAAALPDGTRVRIRPVRREDEPLLRDIFAHLTPADVRFFFFVAVKELAPNLGAELAQIDYDRDIGLLALLEESGVALGLARFVVDPGKRRAEIAIGLRSDWKRRGLGRLLLTRLFDVACRRGIREIFGQVEHDNVAMLSLCRSLGMSVAIDPEDGRLVRVSKMLAADAIGGQASATAVPGSLTSGS